MAEEFEIQIAPDDWRAIQLWMLEWHLDHEHSELPYLGLCRGKFRYLLRARNALMLAVAGVWWQRDVGSRRWLRWGGGEGWQPISQPTLARLFALSEHSSVNLVLKAARRKRLAATEGGAV